MLLLEAKREPLDLVGQPVVLVGRLEQTSESVDELPQLGPLLVADLTIGFRLGERCLQLIDGVSELVSHGGQSTRLPTTHRPACGGRRDNAFVAMVWAFVRLSRPHFLLGGALMFAVGVRSAGGTTVGTYLLGQALVTSIQLTAHYANEYADRHADLLVTNRTLFSGGSGVLASGLLSPRVALVAGSVTSVVAIYLAIATALISLPAGLLAVAALAVSWAYSTPPLRLLDTGWGELATSLVVVGLVPTVGALIASGSIGSTLLWIVAALLPVHVAMMLAFELPDVDTDRAAGKRVLAVRWGSATTRRAMVVLLLMPVAVVMGGVAADALDPAAWWTLGAAAVPAAVVQVTARGERPQLLTASGVAALAVLAGGLGLSL